jgi:molybdate transport system ATP-binding protein
VLSFRARKRLGEFQLVADFELAGGGVLVLVGESGAGKTTVLRTLAGLEHPDDGRIALDGELWFDASVRVDLAPAMRAVGYVAQDYALFPHLSVLDNVAFGPSADGASRATARERAMRSLDRLGVAALAERRPQQLSGGQQQRVALARALVLEPKLLLLDEPLGTRSDDAPRGRGELGGCSRRLPCATLYVTHTPSEALLFGDRIAVLENGAVSQIGSRDDLLRHPRSAYVAEFMGINLFHGTIVERNGDGLARLHTEDGDLWVVDPGAADEVFAAVSPREITLHREPPSGSAQNLLTGDIAEIVPEPPLGERLRVVLASRPNLVAEVTRHASEALDLREGVRVHAAFKATGVSVYS